MTRTDCAFGYSQARLQARLGARPTEADWQRIRATRNLGTLLQAAGTSSLGAWTQGLDARSEVHELERRLRLNWTEQVDSVAAWQPPAWRRAVAWMRWLPYLPGLAKLARGGRAPDWMRTDPVLGPIVALEPRQRADALGRTAMAPLLAGFATPADVPGAWLRHWRSLWPDGTAALPALERLLRQVTAHRRELAALPEAANSEEAQARLDRRLLAALRRNPLSPIVTIAYLALAAIDLARLRGAAAFVALRATEAQRA